MHSGSIIGDPTALEISTVDTHGPETCHSAFAKCRCTAIVERIIMKLVCKMISTVDYHVFGYEITMYYYAIHWELSQCTWLAVDAGRERGRHSRLEQAVLGLWSPHGGFLRRRGRTVLSILKVVKLLAGVFFRPLSPFLV